MVFDPLGDVLTPAVLGNQPVVNVLATVGDSIISQPFAYQLPSIRVFGGARRAKLSLALKTLRFHRLGNRLRFETYMAAVHNAPRIIGVPVRG